MESLEVRDLKAQYFDALSKKDQQSTAENTAQKFESIKWKGISVRWNFTKKIFIAYVNLPILKYAFYSYQEFHFLRNAPD